MIEKALPFFISFAGALVLTLVLTPLVRELNRRLGMVDKPDPRRINKVPIPRGGGVALVIGVLASYLVFHFWSGRPAVQGITDAAFYKLCVLAVGVSLVGLADDKFSLPPKLKLLGQLVIAFLTWFWAGQGFADLWPWLPAWADCLLTVFWLTGAMNAFNLIDGLDGLASGIALIAVMGMAGSLFLAQCPQATLFYFAMMGGLLGFLRYNYNPASVFLGDSGSMFIGYVVASLPLASNQPNSFLVSVGVPLLAMGVPIFDTSLAILRRSLRRLISRGAAGESTAVMTADADHLHHRILRAVGFNQRRTAWILYALAAGAVCVGLLGMYLESRAAGLWLAAVTVAAVVIFRDLARIELFDAGQLLNRVAHNRATASRRRWAKLAVPFYLTFDLLALAAVFFGCCWVMNVNFSRTALRVGLPIRVFAVLFCLVLAHVYRTVWSRAQISNYLRLFAACFVGSLVGAVAIYYAPAVFPGKLRVFTLLYAAFAFLALLVVRLARPAVRDLFYSLDCSRLKARNDVSRVLVYGAGLRYRAFRRELVRTTSANERIIVGLLDDDIVLRNHYIGGIRVLGTLAQAPEVINATNADTVVIACDVTDEWLKVVKDTLEPTGVRIMMFTLTEKAV